MGGSNFPHKLGGKFILKFCSHQVWHVLASTHRSRPRSCLLSVQLIVLGGQILIKSLVWQITSINASVVTAKPVIPTLLLISTIEKADPHLEVLGSKRSSKAASYLKVNQLSSGNWIKWSTDYQNKTDTAGFHKDSKKGQQNKLWVHSKDFLRFIYLVYRPILLGFLI